MHDSSITILPSFHLCVSSRFPGEFYDVVVERRAVVKELWGRED